MKFDKWKKKDFYKILSADENMYKLRRDFNNFHLEDLNFDTKNLISFLSNNKKCII